MQINNLISVLTSIGETRRFRQAQPDSVSLSLPKVGRLISYLTVYQNIYLR